MGELEAKIAKAMNLDTSLRYFELQTDVLVMRLPENSSPSILAEAGNYLKIKMSEAVDSGINKTIIDIHAVKTLNMGVIKLLMLSMQTCADLAVQFVMVGNTDIATECKGFEDTRGWVFYETLEEAKSALCKPALAPATV